MQELSSPMSSVKRWLAGLRFTTITLIPAMLLCFTASSLHAQTSPYCDPSVPTFTVNLTGQPTGSWVSPFVQRLDHCCGVTNPDQCVQFIVTLDPAATGILFDVFSGAMPPGALFYQVNCSPPTPVGEPICLNGVGPHYITFCKPGNNSNQYIITSLGFPFASSDISLNDGCSGIIAAIGYEDTSLTWTSVAPGAPGAYNTYLNCTQGCDSVLVTAQNNPPAFVDYQVCGIALGGCSPPPTCDTVRVYFNPTLGAQIMPVNPTVCFGSTGTTITASGSGGSPPYSYQWSTGATTPSIFAGPGTYTVTVTDTSNCPPATATITVTSFSATITAQAGPDQSVCVPNTTVQLAGSVTGVSTGAWSGGSGTFAPSNTALNATYTPSQSEINAGQATLILTTTGNGTCPPDADTLLITINTFQAQLNSTSTPVICFGQNNGTASVSVSGGTGPFTYSWNSSPVQATATASNLAPGSYTVTVTDGNGCTSSATASITQPAQLSVAAAVQNPVSCNGGANGSISTSVSGGTPSYTYSWSPAGSGATATGLAAGAYTVLVTDASGCTASASATLTQPGPMSATINAQPVSCAGGANGSATVSASGGAGSYAYSWNTTPAQTTATASGLAAGTYSVVITDANGCTLNAGVVITQPSALSATIGAQTNVSCNGGANGSATVIASGGTQAYSYSWSTTPSQQTPAASGLSAGMYAVIVTDANGCTASASVSITQPQALSATITAQANVSCFGGSNGSATVLAGGGVSPYSYSWNSSPPQSSATMSNVAAGAYAVTVTDANGCTASANVTITQPPALALNTAGFATSCSNSCDGQTVVIPSGGTQPFSFLWNTGCNSAGCLNLCPGTYSVTVTDNNGCQASDTAIVNAPPPVTANVTSNPAHCNLPDGSASVSASGGHNPYTYLWSPGNQTTTAATNLTPGAYVVVVTDQLGCQVSATVTVGNVSTLSAGIGSVTNPTCPGFCNGSATAVASGGNAPYQYSWNTTPVQTTATAFNLCAATPYSVIITDAYGCADTATLTISTPLPFNISITAPPALCIGQSTTLSAAVTGGTPPYNYSWSPAGPTVSPLSTTTYTVTITDANGCVSQGQSVTVTVHPPLNIAASGGGTSCANQTVTLTAAAGGGNGGPYTYSWSPSVNGQGASVMVAPSVSTNYTVTVSDGCTNQSAMASAMVVVPQAPPIAATADQPSGCAGMCVHFAGTATGATSWLWNFGDGGTSAQQNPTHCYSQAGNHTVTLTVTDANGCTFSLVQPGMITVHANPAADFTMGPQPTTILDPDICFNSQSSSDVVQWYWNFGDPNDQVTSNTASTCHTYSDTGRYCVDLIVHNAEGCWSTVEYCLYIDPYFSIYVPNAFTPNADGKNDLFLPVATNVKEDTYKMMIFDRWGNMIFSTEDLHEGWDGKANGGTKIAQIDTYVWKIRVRDYTGKLHQLIGHVSIIK